MIATCMKYGIPAEGTALDSPQLVVVGMEISETEAVMHTQGRAKAHRSVEVPSIPQFPTMV